MSPAAERVARDAQIVASADAGARPSQIARDMGLTKNAVAGVLYRAAMKRDGRQRPSRAKDAPKVVRAGKPRKVRKPTFWNEERDAFVRAHYGQDMTAEQIGEKVGCSRSAVTGYAGRIGLSEPNDVRKAARKSEAERQRERRQKASEATVRNVLSLYADQVEPVRALRLTGKGPVEIARALGCDDGRVSRILMALRKLGEAFPALTKSPPKYRHVWKDDEQTAPKVEYLRSRAWDPLDGSEPKLLLERRGCRWPVGEATGADQLFCCQPIGRAGSYCPTHRALSFRPATKNERSLSRAVVRQASYERKVFAA